jgi:IPT/TIG domain/Divergent InlB B-repeat domain/PASTA domain
LAVRLIVALGLLLVGCLASASPAVAANGTGSVIIEGGGNGEVVSSPESGFEGSPPIACDYESPGPPTGTCETELTSGSGVFGLILEAKPDPGFVFAGWEVEGAAVTFGCEEAPTCGGANEAEETEITFKATFEEEDQAPTITALNPIEGPAVGGNTVTITGTALTNLEEVEFGGTAANLATLVEISPTEIEIDAPAHVAGTVDVVVTTEGGTSTNTVADDYTYVEAPAITGLSPNKGPTAGGTTVTISGTDLADIEEIKFGSTPADLATLVEISPTEIAIDAPVHSSGTFSVVVTTPGGASTDTAADDYTYVARPAVTGLNPTSGPASGGNQVEITGLRLSEAEKVEFGTTVVDDEDFIENTETSIKVNAPAHAAGTVNVKVTTVGGTSGDFPVDDYTYEGPAALTVTLAGSGSGSVNCTGGPCAATYAFGTEVTLGATAAAGSTFAGWSGACSGMGACVVTMDAAKAVTATFNLNPPLPPPPQCVVPKVKGLMLGKAKSALKDANCKTGKVTKPKPNKGKKQAPLVVKSSNPDAGTTLPADSKVNLRLKHKPKK